MMKFVVPLEMPEIFTDYFINYKYYTLFDMIVSSYDDANFCNYHENNSN